VETATVEEAEEAEGEAAEAAMHLQQAEATITTHHHQTPRDSVALLATMYLTMVRKDQQIR
jgi:hypothetical protein